MDDSIEYIPGREIRAERDQRRRSGSSQEKPTLGRRILKVLSLGLLGKTKHSADSQKQNRIKPAVAKAIPEKSKNPRGGKPQSRPVPEPRKKSEPRPAAPPDAEAVATPRLHVGNLSYDTVESDLFELFKGFGKVLNAEIVTHQRTQRSKGFGFVQMAGLEEARRAVRELHGKPFMGREITVGAAKAAPPRQEAAKPEV